MWIYDPVLSYPFSHLNVKMNLYAIQLMFVSD